MEEEIQRGNEQIELRKQKLAKLREQGVNPYGERFERTHRLGEITGQFAELENQTVKIAGRLIAKRDQGKAAFANIVDQTGNLQLYTKIDLLGETKYQEFLNLDLGTSLVLPEKSLRPIAVKSPFKSKIYNYYPKRYGHFPKSGTA